MPIGVFTKTGSPSSAASSSSAAVAATTAAGCGRPTRVNVPNADTLSCTWASAPNSGTAVASPAASIRSRASDITATCSCTGSSRSALAPRGDAQGGVQPAERIRADGRNPVHPAHMPGHPGQAEPARG